MPASSPRPDQQRAKFEASKRETIFSAMCELDGVSSGLELCTLLLQPGTAPDLVDVVNVKALIGIDRRRPEAAVTLGTARIPAKQVREAEEAAERPRIPTNLAGEPALEGMNSVRLNEFCVAPPAPLQAVRYGTQIQYSLGPTGSGPDSRVDLVIAEVNRNEIPTLRPNLTRLQYFYTVPEMATKRMVFDLIVHEDLFDGRAPELLSYDIASRGPARARDPERDLDLRILSEDLESLGSNLEALALAEFPRYRELIECVYERLDWQQERFRIYRISLSHPLAGTQVTMVYSAPLPTDQA
ncbi:MAG: hypothetical protein ACI9HE_002842 [Planctomycetota bacterium]|jgi:hypothetical protein